MYKHDSVQGSFSGVTSGRVETSINCHAQSTLDCRSLRGDADTGAGPGGFPGIERPGLRSRGSGGPLQSATLQIAHEAERRQRREDFGGVQRAASQVTGRSTCFRSSGMRPRCAGVRARAERPLGREKGSDFTRRGSVHRYRSGISAGCVPSCRHFRLDVQQSSGDSRRVGASFETQQRPGSRAVAPLNESSAQSATTEYPSGTAEACHCHPRCKRSRRTSAAPAHSHAARNSSSGCPSSCTCCRPS